MTDNDKKMMSLALEASWVTKLEELDYDQFVDFLDEFYNNTQAPSLKAALKVAAKHLRKSLPV
jgi:hypothetical protein